MDGISDQSDKPDTRERSLNAMGRKLYKSETDRKICGVCGGIADYFGIDSTIVRLILVFITLWGIIPGILIYIIAALVMPDELRH